MSFSQTAGTAIIPTFARIILAAAFITAGANKFREVTFSAEQAEILTSYGVEVTPEGIEDMVVAGDESVGTDTGTETETETGADTDTDAGEEDGASAVLAGPGTAAALHNVTLLCHDAGWNTATGQWPVILGWTAALTELIGGVLLVIGFCSRIWGMGLTIAMGSAFYLVSVRLNGVCTDSPLVFAQDTEAFNAVFSQLGLMLLAFGIVMTGPGPLSLDRLMWGRKKPIMEAEDPADFAPSMPRAPAPPPVAPIPTTIPIPPQTPPPSGMAIEDDAPDSPALEIEHDPPPSEGGRPL